MSVRAGWVTVLRGFAIGFLISFSLGTTIAVIAIWALIV